ncbi:hypothetical protein DNU06_07885 [Putridiphycobacter roseus]|uniref:DUF304 domain-containing protein n=1 Tax=Putridiphycobacter roseus TaxID=2219161 RepID=A0A2W1N0D3_9FLAO|nr:hypothetical protein [Putridiphycobacter roseus]PZE17184.1 hypothetical protein DNU06_07885 [Putridiphycobacter roseus]
MDKTINVADGVSFQYFYIGLVAFIISVLCILSADYRILGIVMLLPAIFIFLSIKGTLIDIENKRMKNYLNILNFKIGKWQGLEKFTRIELLLNSQSQTMNHRSISNNIKVRSFFIALTNDQKEKVELKEFTDYEKAKKSLSALGEALNLEIVDRKEIINNMNKSRQR